MTAGVARERTCRPTGVGKVGPLYTKGIFIR